MALSNKNLGKNITASFLKILLKIMLCIQTDKCITLAFLFFNVMKRRSGLKDVIQNSRTFDHETDPFDITKGIFENNVL